MIYSVYLPYPVHPVYPVFFAKSLEPLVIELISEYIVPRDYSVQTVAPRNYIFITHLFIGYQVRVEGTAPWIYVSYNWRRVESELSQI